jgi:hypothetical protein
MASPDQISYNKLADSASDLEVKSKQADVAQEREDQVTIPTELNVENVNNKKVPEVASKKKKKRDFQLPPREDTQLHFKMYSNIIDLNVLNKVDKEIRKECDPDKKEEQRRDLARLYLHEYRLDYLAERWAKNYYRFQDPISIMDSLERGHRLIEGMINCIEERLKADDESPSDSEDSESERCAMSYRKEQDKTRPDGFGASALSEVNYHDTVMKRINEEYAALQLKELEEQVQRGVRSRELAYGSADLDLDIFASRLDQHKGPEWLGQEENEKMTARWHELDAQAREDIHAYEAAINALHNPTPGERLTHSEIRHSCSCGQSCWIRQAACLRAPKFIQDHLDRAERDAAYQDERSVAEQARFTCRVKQFVQHLECRLDIGEQIDDELQEFLREILAHAEGTYRDDEKHQAIQCSRRFVLDGSAESVRLYCRWLRRNPKVEVDSELVESVKRVLKRAALMKQEEAEPSHATAAHSS